MTKQPDGVSTPLAEKKTPKLLHRLLRAVVKPLVIVWSKDVAFHTRLTTLIAILALLAGIIIPLSLAAASTSQPTSVSPTSSPIGQTKDGEQTTCATEETDNIESCILGRMSGSEWSPALEVGDTSVLDVQLYYRNATSEQQKDVVVRVEIPDNLKYLDGTTFLHTSNGTKGVRDGIVKGGLIIGGYLPSGDAHVKFSLVVSDESALLCGENIRVVNYVVTTSGSTRNVGLPVTISKTC